MILNKFLEFVKDLKLKNIAEGCGNLFLSQINKLPQETEIIAHSRIIICDTCNIRNKSICSQQLTGIVERDFLYGQQKRIKGQKVNGCGCNLWCKTMSMQENCPLGKWLSIQEPSNE